MRHPRPSIVASPGLTGHAPVHSPGQLRLGGSCPTHPYIDSASNVSEARGQTSQLFVISVSAWTYFAGWQSP